MQRTALYRHFDSDGLLLYVGVARNPAKRLASHRRWSPWFEGIAKVDIQWFDNEGDAYAAEREAIRTENPLCNRLRYGAKFDPAPWFSLTDA